MCQKKRQRRKDKGQVLAVTKLTEFQTELRETSMKRNRACPWPVNNISGVGSFLMLLSKFGINRKRFSLNPV